MASEHSPYKQHKPLLPLSAIQKVSRKLDQLPLPESVVIMVTAVIVGAGAGFGAVIFQWLIETVQKFSFETLVNTFAGFKPYHLLIIPAVGGLISGPLIYRFAREAKGHGVPEVMEAIALRGGRIRPQVAVIKALASSVCIGTGGSVGREGPMVQIGSALGSTIGQLLNLSEERIRNLVACGAAGGIAATFKAPIAGAIFAMEVILGRLHTVYFGAVVISAVTASIIAQAFEDSLHAFSVPEYTLISPWEMLLYTVLGILAAVGSVGFTKLLYLSEDIWDKFNIPEYVKPALGGLLLGLTGLLTFKIDGFPRVFGAGYQTINQTLFGELAIHVTLLLLVMKMLATILTLGSGSSGGIFAPAMFMGAMLGSSFGYVVNILFPTITAPPGAYALVGMAAFFSGAAHAPVTAILILFEMTGDYRIILPLMLATVMATLISRLINQESIYTLKLARRGVHLEAGHDIDVMQGVTVKEVMNTDFKTIPMNMPLTDLFEIFSRTHTHGFAVVDENEELAGIVSVQDMDRAITIGDIESKTVANIATTSALLVAYPDDPMWKALKRLGTRDVSRLPVVESENSRKIIGIVRRSEIIRAYNRAIMKKAQVQHQAEMLRLGTLDDAALMDIDIDQKAPAIGHRISELKLPDQCLIVSVRRGRKLHIADGYTVLQNGDRVTVFAHQDCMSIVRHRLTGTPVEQKSQDINAALSPARHMEISIPAGAISAGKQVSEIQLPPDCILVSIFRDDKVIVPHGNTTILPGDIIEIFGLEDELLTAKTALTSFQNQ